MTEQTLKDYVGQHGQVKTGIALGVTQTAISKAIRSGRNIIVYVSDDGEVTASENSPFPAKKAKNKGC